MKQIYSLLIIIFFAAACCGANNKPKTDIPVNTGALAEIESLPQNIRNIASDVISSYNGWDIDTIVCIENSEQVSRFLVKGTSKENIDKRKMAVQLLSAGVASDSAEVWSYVILQKLQKDKPFEMEMMYFPTGGTVLAYNAVKDTTKADDKTDVILMTKQDMKLRMVNLYDTTMFTVPMATGKNAGDKKISGDKKTPEGIFTVYAIHDASDWDYDFKDGKGRIKGTYGKYFIRFKENYHIGIHGTHLPETVGLRATEGCIRLTNENSEAIVPMVARSKTLMVVTPAMLDYEVDNPNK